MLTLIEILPVLNRSLSSSLKPDNGDTIDGDIVNKDGKYYLFFKPEGSGSGNKVAVSDQVNGCYVLRDKYVQ